MATKNNFEITGYDNERLCCRKEIRAYTAGGALKLYLEQTGRTFLTDRIAENREQNLASVVTDRHSFMCRRIRP